MKRSTWHMTGAFTLLLAIVLTATATAAEPLRVLILSGANNHDWRTTTPELKQLVEACPRFQVVGVLEDPAKITAELLGGCDVIASNWSAYPEMKGHQWGDKGNGILSSGSRPGTVSWSFTRPPRRARTGLNSSIWCNGPGASTRPRTARTTR